LQTLTNLRARHEKYLLTVPETLKRLDDIIYATKDSILDVCRLLEGCREEVYEGNTIPLGSKMKWVLGDSVAFTRRTANLQQQHAAINVEIMSLRQIDMLKPLERIATTTFENLELLSMERKGPKKRDSTQSKRDKGKYTWIYGVSTTVLGSTEDYEDRGADSNVLDVGQSPPFGLGISQILSNAGPPLSIQQPVQKVYGNSFNSSHASIPTASEVRMKGGEGTDDVEEIGEEDEEGAFYRDLRRQEEDRQRRLAARRRMGWRTL
jgi:hypothetical protein